MGIFLQPDPWSKAVRDALPGLIPLGLLGLWRWGMFLFRVLGFLMYKPQPPTAVDAFSTADVTLIIPTIDTDEEAMHEAMRSWVLNEPHAIIIVTVGENLQKELQKIASRSIAADITTVLYVEKPANKRIQLVHGINAATTDLVCFTDDDAIWNANFLKWLLVPFNDEKMGGTGSSQIMRPNDLTKPPTVFERIADMRLSGRMLEAAASTYYDGSVSCLSGRTALYHKRIMNDSFPLEFTGELWRNKYPLISGDDKFMTRWIVSHGWKMSMQISPECTLATTFKADGKFFMQILRWTRNTWRSDFKSLVLERNIWYRYPVQAVLMVDRMISPFTLMAGPILFVLSMALIRTIESWTDIITALCIYIVWVLVSRTLRIIPHFYRCPEDITYLIFFIGYQYYFACLKLYALFTLHVTSWGTREGVAAAGAGGKEKDEIDPEAAHEQRVQMAKKGRTANKTYQRGNIALMRRIHMHNLDDDGEMEEAVRARLSQAGTLYNGGGAPGSMFTGMAHTTGPGSAYTASQVPSLYHAGSVAGYGSQMPQYFSRMHGPGSLYGTTWSQAYSAAPSQAYSQAAPSMGAPSMGAPSVGAPSVTGPGSVVSRQ